ncbi:unannotated protein [freshwater metagenome]|uniref:Unannotated protein n=1 Tax=freshwater metagenome TaxID=449393 RepID=A0A6J7HHP7_9ZZZZ|nr:SRPBCC family protein [Actinomycetota bacterium]
MFKVRDNQIAITLTINAPIRDVWNQLADWEKQGEWMLQTKVWVTSEITQGVGTKISALTGFHRLSVLDTMEVTNWEPPHLCDVVHTGRVIRGTGRFKLREISTNVTAFDWSEVISAPPIIFLLIKPALYFGVRISLARFARTFR